MTGAQALIESLLQEQVDHIFGYAGATICPAVEGEECATMKAYVRA